MNPYLKNSVKFYFINFQRYQALDSLTKKLDLGPVSKHRLSEKIEEVVQEHLKYDLQDDLNSNVWELLCSDGEMKIYRRELEENGIVLEDNTLVCRLPVSGTEKCNTIAILKQEVIVRIKACGEKWCRIIIDKATTGWIEKNKIWGV